MAQQVVIHPVPRENVPYSLAVEIEGGRAVSARCGATALWGLEAVLTGQHPFDALHIVQRSHVYAGVSHAIAVAEGLEGMLQIVPPVNGQILRNILQGLEFIHAHVTHFYQGVLPDYMSINGTPAAGEKMPPVAGKTIREHYWQAFEVLADIHKMMAIFGGKMPFQMSIVPGGVAVQPDFQKIFALYSRWKKVLRFIRDVYISDIEMLFATYGEYGAIGAGSRRLLAMGAFPAPAEKGGGKMLLPAGALPGGGATAPDVKSIAQDMSYAWFTGGAGEIGTPPEAEIKSQAYSWTPALKYNGQHYETGPLARMILAGEGKTARLGVSAYSVKGRHLARAYESLWLAGKMEQWISDLHPQKPAATGKISVPEEGDNWSVAESPAGSVVHRFRLQGGKIVFYRVFGSASWNLAPRDSGGNMGPLEEAFSGVPVVNQQNHVELLRVFRAFS